MYRVCVASIVRIAAIWRLPNPSADCQYNLPIFKQLCSLQSNKRQVEFDTLMLAGIIQSGLAIVAACLPTLGPLISAAFRCCTRPRGGHRGKRKLRLPTNSNTPQTGCRLYGPALPAPSHASIHRQGLIQHCVSGNSQESGDVLMSSSRSFNPSLRNYDEEEIGRETRGGEGRGTKSSPTSLDFVSATREPSC